MIKVPQSMAEAVAQIDRLTERLANTSAELDNIHAVHHAQVRATALQAAELMAYRQDVKDLRDALEAAHDEIAELRDGAA